MEINGIIQNSKGTVESADAKVIMSYDSQNIKFRYMYGLEENGTVLSKISTCFDR